MRLDSMVGKTKTRYTKELYDEVVVFVRLEGRVTQKMLTEKFNVGQRIVQRLMDAMEYHGVIEKTVGYRHRVVEIKK